MVLLVFLLILSILILIHEFGHFYIAKKVGVHVEEFGLGLPPRIFGKKIGETLYSLNLLPFGGFVKLKGEDFTDIKTLEEEKHDPKSYVSKTPLQRSAIITAGVFMNYFLAVVLFYTVLFSNGFKTFYIPILFDYNFKFGNIQELGTVVTAMDENSPAQKSGVQVGDAIKTIDGTVVNNVLDVRDQLSGKLEKEVTLEVFNLKSGEPGALRTIKTEPIANKDGSAVIGVYLTKSVSINYDTPLLKTFSGFLHSYNVLAYSISGFKQIISLSLETRDITPVTYTVAGPVGIYQVVGGVLKYGGDKVLLNILDFIALMSVSLAFINILPFPALDGGRLLFIFIEKVSRRRINPALEARIHLFGMVILLLLMLLITIKDVVI